MTHPDFLSTDKFGEIFLTGHRITLYHVVTKYRDGASPEDILDDFPTLAPALVYKVIGFYLENQAQVDEYVRKYREDLERLERETPRGPTLEELQRRLAMKTRAASA